MVEDPNYNYLSARFPPDSECLAKRAVELVNQQPTGDDSSTPTAAA